VILFYNAVLTGSVSDPVERLVILDIKMFVAIKQGTKRIKVDVSEAECPYYTCFSPHIYQHRSYNNGEGSMTSNDKFYSCSHRNYHGCPDVRIKR
jgi:hypothetical protein